MPSVEHQERVAELANPETAQTTYLKPGFKCARLEANAQGGCAGLRAGGVTAGMPCHEGVSGAPGGLTAASGLRGARTAWRLTAEIVETWVQSAAASQFLHFAGH